MTPQALSQPRNFVTSIGMQTAHHCEENETAIVSLANPGCLPPPAISTKLPSGIKARFISDFLKQNYEEQ